MGVSSAADGSDANPGARTFCFDLLVPISNRLPHRYSMINSTQDLIPHVASVATALPANYVDQQTLTSALRAFWSDKCGNLELFDRLHKATKVSGRYLALPMSEYPELTSFALSNSAWMRVAPELGAQAARRALCDAGLEPTDINHFAFVTGTGIATPSIDTSIIGGVGLAPAAKATAVFWFGWVAPGRVPSAQGAVAVCF